MLNIDNRLVYDEELFRAGRVCDMFCSGMRISFHSVPVLGIKGVFQEVIVREGFTVQS